MSEPAIWWIRRDLRLTDNPALTAALALAGSAGVLPLFILDDALLGSRWAGAPRVEFLFAGLRALDESLRARGSRLIVRAGDPLDVLTRLRVECGAGVIVAERDYSPYATQRDTSVAEALPLRLVDGVTVLPPEAVRKDDGTPYTVYTPFSKRWKAVGAISPRDILRAPERIATPSGVVGVELPSGRFASREIIAASEAEANRRLGAFVRNGTAPLYRYANDRNRPDLEGTSQLSPYLRFGLVSARIAALAASEAMARAPGDAARKSAETWLNELVWREFYVSILHAFPSVRHRAFQPAYEGIEWQEDDEGFAAWQSGQTGYPLVDAAMRQLAATGWMHNRTRMVTASFLVKDLLIDWRRGELHFMQHLLDGDPASNNGGWQWSAGVGTDAAPYFRVFNPVAQGRKFDPHGNYVRRWLPELAHVPDDRIHAPWEMTNAERVRAGCRIGVDYPAPIIDHAFARERALAAYAAARAR